MTEYKEKFFVASNMPNQDLFKKHQGLADNQSEGVIKIYK